MASKDLRDSRRDGFNEGPKDSTLCWSHKSLVLGVPLDGEHVFTPRQVNPFDCPVFRVPGADSQTLPKPRYGLMVARIHIQCWFLRDSGKERSGLDFDKMRWRATMIRAPDVPCAGRKMLHQGAS